MQCHAYKADHKKKKSNQPEIHVYFIELSPVSSIGHRIH